ncbi:hypothetical protein TrLO_g13547 [Triparma laevis f. longispina]|uniref:Uncharacterized protein n=1 Tax=Triparma laevis f. longispina TaxID=1714387 RepID=A0A9W7F2K0_9STRA|nr:hypothetical protein TrLO_g13547 [Triparma laevis f. longispina]
MLQNQALRECKRQNYHFRFDKSGIGRHNEKYHERVGMYLCDCLMTGHGPFPISNEDRTFFTKLENGVIPDLLHNINMMCTVLAERSSGFEYELYLMHLAGSRHTHHSVTKEEADKKRWGSGVDVGEPGEVTFRAGGWLFSLASEEARTPNSKHLLEEMKRVQAKSEYLQQMNEGRLTSGSYELSFPSPYPASWKSVAFDPGTYSVPEHVQNLTKLSNSVSQYQSLITLFNDVYLPATMPFHKTLKSMLTEDSVILDLLVVDVASLGGHLLAESSKVPTIINSPTLLPILSTSKFPSWGTSHQSGMGIWEACLNILYPRLLSVGLTPPFLAYNRLRWSVGLEPMYTFNLDWAKAVAVNTAQDFDYPRNFGSNVYFSGWVGSRTNSKMNLDEYSLGDSMNLLQEWCGENKILYVQLGEMPQLSRHHAKTIMQGVSRARSTFSGWALRACSKQYVDLVGKGDCERLQDFAELKAVWIVPKQQQGAIPEIPPKFFNVMSRAPGFSDQDYYAAGSKNGFSMSISHCGLQAAQNSLVFSAPLVCVPFFGDQFGVSARVQESGSGLEVLSKDMKAKAVGNAVVKVLLGLPSDAEVDFNVDLQKLMSDTGKVNSYSKSAHIAGSRLLEGGGADYIAGLIEGVYTGEVSPFLERRHVKYGFDGYYVLFGFVCLLSSVLSISVRMVEQKRKKA